MEEEQKELLNGDEVAACLNDNKVAEIYFKINYVFK